MPDGLQEIDSKKTFEEAFAYAAPQMDGSLDNLGPGVTLAAAWLAEHGRWSDVVVPDGATTTNPARILKDPRAERGKKACFWGQLFEIVRVDAMPGRQLWTGTMRAGGQVAHFVAAKSSGDLVANRPARLCARVTGSFSFTNSEGGTTQAPQFVGIFDLPENH